LGGVGGVVGGVGVCVGGGVSGGGGVGVWGGGGVGGVVWGGGGGWGGVGGCVGGWGGGVWWGVSAPAVARVHSRCVHALGSSLVHSQTRVQTPFTHNLVSMQIPGKILCVIMCVLGIAVYGTCVGLLSDAFQEVLERRSVRKPTTLGALGRSRASSVASVVPSTP